MLEKIIVNFLFNMLLVEKKKLLAKKVRKKKI